MKKLLLLLFLSFTISIFSQVTNEGKPASWEFTKKFGIEAISLAEIDILKIKSCLKHNNK